MAYPALTLPGGFVRFGPVHMDKCENEGNKIAKDAAWNHIIKLSDEYEEAIIRSIARIEKQAMESYDDGDFVERGSAFRQMMARDGCFFLQLVLHILGGRKLLGYNKQDPYFGEKEDPRHWIPALFFPGNHIPYVVIRALMKQPFFQNVIANGIWRFPPTQLEKLVLYRVVVEPELKRPRPISMLFSKYRFREPPSNVVLINALHSLLLGTKDSTDLDLDYSSDMAEFHDLEAGGDDSDVVFPSAGELSKKGIRLKVTYEGISSIQFRDLVFCAYLYVPPLAIDSYTENVLHVLANYERDYLKESDRKVTNYLRLMRDLAPTYKDFIILKRSGIIQVNHHKSKNTIIPVLDQLVSSHKCNFSLNFRHTRHKIIDYGGPPWRHINFFLGLLALLQVIFAILPYLVTTK